MAIRFYFKILMPADSGDIDELKVEPPYPYHLACCYFYWARANIRTQLNRIYIFFLVWPNSEQFLPFAW